jgi:hypothetical protein
MSSRIVTDASDASIYAIYRSSRDLTPDQAS